MNGIAFNTLQSANKNEPKVDVKDEKNNKNNGLSTQSSFSSVLNTEENKTEESGRNTTTNSTGTSFFGNNDTFKTTSTTATTEAFDQERLDQLKKEVSEKETTVYNKKEEIAGKEKVVSKINADNIKMLEVKALLERKKIAEKAIYEYTHRLSDIESEIAQAKRDSDNLKVQINALNEEIKDIREGK